MFSMPVKEIQNLIRSNMDLVGFKEHLAALVGNAPVDPEECNIEYSATSRLACDLQTRQIEQYTKYYLS